MVQEVQDRVRKSDSATQAASPANQAASNGPILRFLSGAFVTAGGVAAARSRKATTRALAGQVLSSLRGISSSSSMIWVSLCIYIPYVSRPRQLRLLQKHLTYHESHGILLYLML